MAHEQIRGVVASALNVPVEDVGAFRGEGFTLIVLTGPPPQKRWEEALKRLQELAKTTETNLGLIPMIVTGGARAHNY